MSEETRWWWVRHAPVVGHDGRMYGNRDVAADVSDAATFRVLARLLPDRAMWVTSHLKRAVHTAEAIAAAGLESGPPMVEPRLAEQHFGDWQGRPYADIPGLVEAEHRHPFWFAVAAYRPPGGETFLEVIERVSAVIDHMTEAHRGRDIVAVAHGGVIRAALAHTLGLDPDRALGIATDNLAITRIDHAAEPESGGHWQVAFVNHRPR